VRVEAIVAHACSLERDGVAAGRSESYADACIKRAIEVRDQELRSFVVRQSVFRIHCVVAVAVFSAGIGVFARTTYAIGEVAVALIGFSSVVIVSSTRSIMSGIAPR